MKTTKCCLFCKQTLSTDKFGKSRGRRDGFHDHCKECRKKDFQQIYQRNKKYAHDYKKERGCKYCSENNPICLDFHHTKGKKKFSICHGYRSYSLENLKKEIEKCEVVCSS